MFGPVLSGSYSITKPASTIGSIVLEGPQPQYSFYVDNIVMTEMYMNAGNWREIADQRIEQYRKRDASIKVVDKNGNPRSGATVEVKQTRNHFAFGSALRRSAMYDERYTKFLKKILNGLCLKTKLNGIILKPAGVM